MQILKQVIPLFKQDEQLTQSARINTALLKVFVIPSRNELALTEQTFLRMVYRL